jgi:hypothetical protein
MRTVLVKAHQRADGIRVNLLNPFDEKGEGRLIISRRNHFAPRHDFCAYP